MSDKPKPPTTPAIYRNKTPKKGKPAGGLGQFQSSGKNAPIQVGDISTSMRPSVSGPIAKEPTLPKKPNAVSVGELASFNSKTQSVKTSGQYAPEVSNPIKEGSKPNLPKAPSLSDQIHNLGDLAKITPAMARSRPVSDTGKAIPSDVKVKDSEFDTKMEKSHAFK